MSDQRVLPSTPAEWDERESEARDQLALELMRQIKQAVPDHVLAAQLALTAPHWIYDGFLKLAETHAQMAAVIAKLP